MVKTLDARQQRAGNAEEMGTHEVGASYNFLVTATRTRCGEGTETPGDRVDGVQGMLEKTGLHRASPGWAEPRAPWGRARK